MSDSAKWYVAHTYSGYENTVAASIEKAVENRSLRDLIHEVNIPLETVTEITDNGPKTVERKVFPGYVLVKMVMTDETWHLVRNVRGVTGFVGSALNTVFYLGLLWGLCAEVISSFYGVDLSGVGQLVMTTAYAAGIPEAIVSCVVVGAVCKALEKTPLLLRRMPGMPS